MNKISWQHAKIHYSERGDQNYGAVEEKDFTGAYKSKLLMDTRGQTAMTKAGKIVKCLFLQLLFASMLCWTLPLFCSGSIYFRFHPRVPRHADSLQLSSQLQHKSQNTGCCLLRWAQYTHDDHVWFTSCSEWEDLPVSQRSRCKQKNSTSHVTENE